MYILKMINKTTTAAEAAAAATTTSTTARISHIRHSHPNSSF